jgi:hypothetical protein
MLNTFTRCHFASVVMLSVVMQSLAMLNVVKLSVAILNVVPLNVVMLNVIMLSVMVFLEQMSRRHSFFQDLAILCTFLIFMIFSSSDILLILSRILKDRGSNS